MKKTFCAFLTAVAVGGCQSTCTTCSVGPNGSPNSAVAMRPVRPDGQLAQTASHAGEIQQVGYNTGMGAMQNRTYGHQRVGRAMPSQGGMLPGGMPYPGMDPNCPPGMGGMGGMGGMLAPNFIAGRTQVRFLSPTNMKIAWQAPDATGKNSFTAPQLEVPARYNFLQARIYRLKLTDIAGREGLELYPTLEVYPGNAKVDAYLAHNAVPIEFTAEDFDQVQAGNFVTKVIYLPDAKYQDPAIAGVETLVSTRLDPGSDPVKEANKRGSILCVIRVGSVDLEMMHSPDLYPQPPAMMMAPAVEPKLDLKPAPATNNK